MRAIGELKSRMNLGGFRSGELIVKRGQRVGELAGLEIDHLLDSKDLQRRLGPLRVHERYGAVGGTEVDADHVAADAPFECGIKLRKRFGEIVGHWLRFMNEWYRNCGLLPKITARRAVLHWGWVACERHGCW